MNTAAFNTEGDVSRQVLHVEWRVSAPIAVVIRKEPGGDTDFATFEERHPWESCCGISDEDLVEVR